MKMKSFRALLVLTLLLSLTIPAHAETLYGNSGWRVEFTSGGRLEDNFTASDVNQAFHDMQPGDNVILTVGLENNNAAATDWYMTNTAIAALKDGGTGGVYTYILTYRDAAGSATTLFSSDTLSAEGLQGASEALEDYFYLDTLSSGETGSVTLEVGLDGETQGNDYQNSLADLAMNFAVETNSGGTSGPAGVSVVKTGDDTALTPFILLAAISGTLLLLLCIYGRKARRDEEKEAE